MATSIRRSKRRAAFRLLFTLFTVGVAGMGVFVYATSDRLRNFGANPKGERLERVRSSPQSAGDVFENQTPTRTFDPAVIPATLESLVADTPKEPASEIPVVTDAKLAGDGVVWLGHSTVFINLQGIRMLLDPVFSERVSPLDLVGPARKHPSPRSLEELLPIDGVLVSHDHYDHLDRDTVERLAASGTQFFVPLGIGAHLAFWGVPEAQITDLDWWETAELGGLAIVSAPGRHYSGRGPTQAMRTLWSGWVISGSDRRVFYSGDTGIWEAMSRQIADKYGPFDLTILKVGQYDESWIDIHLDPEQAVKTHQLLQGKRMLPVHWLTFDLAYHSWDEPIVRAYQAAQRAGIDMVTPRPGERVPIVGRFDSQQWWQGL